MKKYLISGAAGILLALCISFFSHEHSLKNFAYFIGAYDHEMFVQEIEQTLKLFNRNFASFFNTGGSLAGLNEFPAANMIKRRIFQEIDDWRKNNQIIVYDRDVFELESIDRTSPVSAVAIAREVWFMTIQDRGTRKSIMSGVKANSIRVRYRMRKEGDTWRVTEYEVFGVEDTIPVIPKGRV
ncbi:MAG: hypothetical protein JSV11_03350 [Nitrospiraceae bacterium]|nr:MAG: hypothetical protein JSV11_03350 [Nitrospiraceae bacterium]